MCDGEKLLSPSFHNFPILIFFSPPTSSFSPLRRAPKPTPSPSPAIVSVFSSPLALALHRRRAAVGLFFPLRRSLFICLLSTSDHPPRLHLLLSPPSLTPASFSSLSRHFSLFAGLTILPSSSEPPQPSTSASPPSLLCSSPPMHQIPPPWSLLFHFYTHDPRGFSFADDHGCCLSSFFLLTVSLCFLTTSTTTCLFFSDLRPRDLSPCCRLFSASIIVGSFAVDLLGFVDLIKECHRLGLLFRLLFRRSPSLVYLLPPSTAFVFRRRESLPPCRRRNPPSPPSSPALSPLPSPPSWPFSTSPFPRCWLPPLAPSPSSSMHEFARLRTAM